MLSILNGYFSVFLQSYQFKLWVVKQYAIKVDPERKVHSNIRLINEKYVTNPRIII